MGLVKFKSNKTGEVVDVDFPLHSQLIELVHADGSKTQEFRSAFQLEYVQQLPEIAPVDGSALDKLGEGVAPVELGAPAAPPAPAGPHPLLASLEQLGKDVAATLSEHRTFLGDKVLAALEVVQRLETKLDHILGLQRIHGAAVAPAAETPAPTKTE